MKATHNSATGEKSGGILSLLVAPFSRCQSKSLLQQWDTGIRLYDIRIRKIGNDWFFAHGLWRSKKTIGYALSQLNMRAFSSGEKAKLLVTYEWDCPDKTGFVKYVNELAKVFTHLDIVEINVKKPKWRCLKRYSHVPYRQCFTVIEGWRCLFPIPRLWHWIDRKQPHTHIDGVYSMVDFA